MKKAFIYISLHFFPKKEWDYSLQQRILLKKLKWKCWYNRNSMLGPVKEGVTMLMISMNCFYDEAYDSAPSFLVARSIRETQDISYLS